MSPEIEAGVAVSGAITFDVCLNDITILGNPIVDGLCLSTITDLLSPTPAADSARCDAVATSTSGEKIACESCELCPEGGYMFNCANVDEQLVSTTCSGYYPTSFGDVARPEKVVPVLDGLRR